MRVVPALALAALASTAGAQEKGCIQKPMMYIGHHMDGFGHGGGDRPVIGLGTSSGSVRDTLGVLVISVASNGPAEKAGIEEGDRIATANGVDLRVQAADASDQAMHGLMAHRLARTIQKGKAGDPVELRVYHNGQYHTLKVATVKSSELASDEGNVEFGEMPGEDFDMPGADFHMPAMMQLRDHIRMLQPPSMIDEGVHKL